MGASALELSNHTPIMQICTKCGKELPATEYYKDPRKEGRLRPVCKSCWAIRKKAYRKNNRDRIAESDRRYYQANKEKLLKRKAKWQKENRERVTEQQRVRREPGNNLLLKLKTPCVKCGETRPWVIQFHHIDPSKKAFEIRAETVISKDLETVNEEVAKCACLCANCHIEFHRFYGTNPDGLADSFDRYLGGEMDETITRPSRNREVP